MDETTYRIISRLIASNRIEAAIKALTKVDLPSDLEKQFTMISNRWYLVQSKKQKGLLIGGRADKAQLAVSDSLIDFLYFAHAMEQSVFKNKKRFHLKTPLLRIAFSMFPILIIGSLLAANTWYVHYRPVQQFPTLIPFTEIPSDSTPSVSLDSVPAKTVERPMEKDRSTESKKVVSSKKAALPAKEKTKSIQETNPDNNPKTIFAKPSRPPSRSVVSSDTVITKVDSSLTSTEAAPEKEYYRSIGGTNYDRKILEEAERLTEGGGDGRISKADAKVLLGYFTDQQVITASETRTLTYIQKQYKWTDAASKWFNQEYEKLPKPSS